MAITVQRGTFTLANGLSTDTINRGVDPGFDTTVTTTRTVLKLSWRTAGTDASIYSNYSVRAVLTDGDTITLVRGGTTSDVICEWELIEFEEGQAVVQHITVTLTGATSNTGAISAPTISGGRFIVPGGTSSTENTAARVSNNVVLTSSTVATVERANTNGNITVSFQVVDHIAATVQTVQKTLTNTTNATDDNTITAVDTAKTLVFGTMRATSDGANYGDVSWDMTFTSTTNLRFTRNGTGSVTFVITAFVVSFSDDTTVERATSSHADGTATVNNTVAAVTLAESACFLSGLFMPGSFSRASVTAWGRGLMTVALTSTTNARTVKGITTTAAVGVVQVVQFGAAAPPVGPVVDPETGTTNGSGVETTTLTSDTAGRVLTTAYRGATVVGRTTVLFS